MSAAQIVAAVAVIGGGWLLLQGNRAKATADRTEGSVALPGGVRLSATEAMVVGGASAGLGAWGLLK